MTGERIGKPILCDGIAHRDVWAFAKPCVWVTTHEQEMKNRNGQPKVIMLYGSQNGRQVLSVKFRWSKVGDTDNAKIQFAVQTELKAICVNQGNGRVPRNKHTGVV
jgi:hypothetical protein